MNIQNTIKKCLYPINSKLYSQTMKIKLLSNFFKIVFFEMLKFTLKYKDENFKFLGHTLYINPNIYISHLALLLEIFYTDTYETKKLNNPEPTIFDLGANIGVATLYFKTLYPNSKIYAFEPVPETFELLKKNMSNLWGVEIFPYAVGSEEEITISYSEAGDVLSRKNGNLKKNVAVKSISIKKFIEENKINHIDMLKIDIEGSEIEVLRDLKDNFNIIDNIVMEWHYSIEDFKNLSKELNLKKYYNIQISNNIIKLTRD